VVDTLILNFSDARCRHLRFTYIFNGIVSKINIKKIFVSLISFVVLIVSCSIIAEAQ
jgi:hypothetical protein